MRLLILSPLPPPVGGISRWSILTLKYLRNSDISYQHINISPKYKGNVNTFKRMFYGILDLFKISICIQNSMKQNKYNALHLTTSASFSLLRDIVIMRRAHRNSVKTVYHLHFGAVPTLAQRNNFEWKLLKRVFKYCDAVIAIDSMTYNVIKECSSKVKIYQCPNPVSIDEFAPLLKAYCDRDKKIVFCGHILKSKGIEELLSAWEVLSAEFNQYTLEIIGCAYNNEYLKTLEIPKRTVILGERSHEETIELISAATVLILPSYTEGFPNVVLEAMALKVPMIATRVGAIPEMLSEGCGLLINPKSAQEIITATETILNDKALREGLAETAYVKVKKYYDLEAVGNKYKEIWENK